MISMWGRISLGAIRHSDGSGATINIAGSASSSISKTAALPHAIDHDFSGTPSIELVGILRGDVDGSL